MAAIIEMHIFQFRSVHFSYIFLEICIEIQPVFAAIHRKFCKVCDEKWQNYNNFKLILST